MDVDPAFYRLRHGRCRGDGGCGKSSGRDAAGKEAPAIDRGATEDRSWRAANATRVKLGGSERRRHGILPHVFMSTASP
jgi:hypothetical protein